MSEVCVNLAPFNIVIPAKAGIQFDLALQQDVKVKIDDQSCGLLKIASGLIRHSSVESRRDDEVHGDGVRRA